MKTFVQDGFSNFLNELKILYILFKKESVFKYLFVIVILMLVTGLVFFFLEYDNIAQVNANVNKQGSLAYKMVTVMYWAIVTIATCGYGDLAPLTTVGRFMVIIVLYLSVATVSLFTANLASALTTKKLMERRGIMNVNAMEDHFVICGWKLSMDKILDEMIQVEIFYGNPRPPLNKIIVIANVEPDTIELFNQQYPQYQEINILRGEHYNETLLRRSNVQKAKKVMVLADESVSGASNTEVDSKTVMAAMTIRSISLNVKVCAELLDRKFEKYLRQAHIEDVIFTNEYSKVLIANSFAQEGISKIVNELLDVNTPSFIRTDKLPDEYIGRPYSELRTYFHAHGNILIGLLENVGSYHERKNEALREAQKTADVMKLIENLKMAKKLENNLPNVHPVDDYCVPPNSLAILIGRRAV